MKLAAGVALAVALSGCVQATRHSNAIVFGTNTSLGINVGTNATSVPTINVGYNRQEAVFLPVVANVGEGQRRMGAIQPLLTPCDVSAPVQVLNQSNGRSTTPFPIHPCLLVATNRQATDSYSVLASFGAKFAGRATGPDVDAQGGLAQYFATGMAAQLLANNGGASVVNVSAAPPSQSTSTNAPASLFGTDLQRERAVTTAASYDSFKGDLLERIANDPNDETMLANLRAFETRIGTRTLLSDDCMTKDSCSAFISSAGNNPFDANFGLSPDALQAALQRWGQP